MNQLCKNNILSEGIGENEIRPIQGNMLHQEMTSYIIFPAFLVLPPNPILHLTIKEKKRLGRKIPEQNHYFLYNVLIKKRNS